MNDKITKHIVNKANDKALLQTDSFHHQFVALEGLAIKRYVKTSVGVLTALRIDYWNSSQVELLPNGLMEVFLKTDTRNWDHVSAIPFRYEDNVIELYTPEDVASFERRNKVLIDSGALVEYVDDNYHYAPQNYKTAIMTDNDGNVVGKRVQPLEFVLAQIEAPFTHSLKRSTVKRG